MIDEMILIMTTKFPPISWYHHFYAWQRNWQRHNCGIGATNHWHHKQYLAMLWAQTMLIGRLFKPLEYRETPIFIAIAISRIWKHNPSKVGQISIHCTIPKTMLFLLVLWPYKLFNFGCWRVFLLGGCSYHTHNLGHIGNDWHFAKPTHPSPCQWMRPIHHGQLLLHPRQWMWQIHQWPVATTPSPIQPIHHGLSLLNPQQGTQRIHHGQWMQPIHHGQSLIHPQ